MHGHGKSDRPGVPATPPNKPALAGAEAVEGRGPGKGNAASKTRPGHRAGVSAPSALARVRQVARQDRDVRFTALLHHVDVDRLRAAYGALNPRAATGVDKVTWYDYGQDLEANLRDLHARVHRGAYRARPSRRVYIPKADGRQRPLGVAALEDKILQRAVVEVLSAIYETDFLGFSYGFRPGRSPHRALDALAAGIYRRKVNWVLDADIKACLVPSSHCPRVHGRGVEERGVWLWDVDSQAFPASVADVQGLQLAALDTLQHRLAGDAEGSHGVDDRDVAGGGVFDEQGAELVVDADPPGGARGVLFAADEAGLEPAVQGGGGDAEFVGGLADREQLAVGRLGGRLVCRDVAVAAQPADDDRGEALAGGGAAALAVEDPSDLPVVVVDSEPREQLDRVLVGADRRLRLGERDGEFGDRTAAPADREHRAARLTHDVDEDLFDQRPQQLLAVAVGGRRCRPDAAEVGAECQQPLALVIGQRPRPLLLAQRELGFDLGELCERVLPVALKTAGDESVLGLDLAVAALRPLGLVLRALDLQPPLLERGVVILLKRLGRLQGGLHAGRGERREQRAGDRLVDLPATDPQAPAAAVVDQDARRAVIGGALVPAAALVVDLELAPAAAADGDPLQQRGAFADRAAGLVRARARVASDPLTVALEGRLVDVAAVVLPDQHVPFCLREATHPLARLPVLVDVPLAAGLAERVCAGIDGALEHAMDLVVGRRGPLDLAVSEAAHRELHPLAAHPQPHLADRAELDEPVEDGGDRAAHGLVGIEQDLALLLAPHQPDRQRLAQLPAGGLVADPALKPGAQHVQLGLAHRALQAEQQPVVERPGVIQPVGVADHRVGHAAQIQQPVPIDVVAGEPRDLQAEHQPGVPERDLGRQPREPRPVRQPRAGDPQVLVDHDDLLAGEPELDRALHERVLAGGRLRVALKLRLRGLAHIHERAAAQMRGGQLLPLAHSHASVRCSASSASSNSSNASSRASLGRRCETTGARVTGSPSSLFTSPDPSDRQTVTSCSALPSILP